MSTEEKNKRGQQTAPAMSPQSGTPSRSQQTERGALNYKDLDGYKFEDLKIGMQATVSRTITETDLRNFSGVSGDTNPMHLNEEYAKHTPFGGCIVHGMLTASLISAAVGTKLPGPGCIYMSQTLRFLAPVHVGDTVYATVTVKELFAEKRRALLTTQCRVKDAVVIDGEALLKVPSRLK